MVGGNGNGRVRWPGWLSAVFALAFAVCFALSLLAAIAALENKQDIKAAEEDIDEIRAAMARIELAIAERETAMLSATYEAAEAHQAYEANIKAKLGAIEGRLDAANQRDH